MPALTDPFAALILVSGANGFLASWIVGDLLKNGYSVRAAVRSEDKGQHLLKAYAEYGSKLQLSIVQDMSIVCPNIALSRQIVMTPVEGRRI
jgi:nucleoside-diphosphate-sugar epimerase